MALIDWGTRKSNRFGNVCEDISRAIFSLLPVLPVILVIPSQRAVFLNLFCYAEPLLTIKNVCGSPLLSKMLSGESLLPRTL